MLKLRLKRIGRKRSPSNGYDGENVHRHID